MDDSLQQALKRIKEIERKNRLLQEENQQAKRIHTMWQESLRQLKETRKELKRNEQKLIAAKTRAEEASQAKSEFLSRMSHEIRTPMHGILGMLQLIELSKLDTDERSKVTTAHFSAKNLLHLLDNILDFSKIESGKLELDSSEFNLYDLIDDILSVFTRGIIDQNIKLDCILPHDLPEWFISDPTRIRQILINLIGNAVKFTHDGEIHVDLKVLNKTDNTSTLEFSISDTGIGIKSDVIEKIFDPFNQADNSTTRNYGGTGLGLSITKTLVSLLGGKLDVQSTPGKGSCFSFELTLNNLNRKTSSTKGSCQDKYIYIIDNNNRLKGLEKYFEYLEATCSIFTDIDSSNIHNITNALDSETRNPDFIFVSKNLGRKLIVDLGNKISSYDKAVKLVINLQNYNDSQWLDEIQNKEIIYPPITINKVLNSLYASPEPQTKQNDSIQTQFNAHILLAEDNAVNKMVAIGILEKFGCTVDIADNGQIAVDKYKNNNYDLIFMDYQMPIMDGLQSTHAIREFERNNKLELTPIVALTANAVENDLRRYLREGMNDYLIKPFSVEDITSKLKKWLGGNNKNPQENINQPLLTNQNESECETSILVEHVNMRKLKELESMLGDDYNHLLETFLSSSTQIMAQLHEMYNTRYENVEEIARLIHSLKGTSGNMGASSMHKYAVQLDKLVKENDLNTMQELLDEIDNSLNAFKLVAEKEAS